jgi:hypothetical protein
MKEPYSPQSSEKPGRGVAKRRASPKGPPRVKSRNPYSRSSRGFKIFPSVNTRAAWYTPSTSGTNTRMLPWYTPWYPAGMSGSPCSSSTRRRASPHAISANASSCRRTVNPTACRNATDRASDGVYHSYTSCLSGRIVVMPLVAAPDVIIACTHCSLLPVTCPPNVATGVSADSLNELAGPDADHNLQRFDI